MTYRSIPELRLYNPSTCLTGPWLERGGRHYSQTVWRDPDNPGVTKRCDVEYMLELPDHDRLQLYQVWSLQLTMPSSDRRPRQHNKGDIFYREEGCEMGAIFGLLMVIICHGWPQLTVVIKNREFDTLAEPCHERDDRAVTDLGNYFRQMAPLEVNNCSKKLDKEHILDVLEKLQNKSGKSVFESFLLFSTLDFTHICNQDILCKRAFLANGICTI